MKRFIREYASYKRNAWMANNLMDDKIKSKCFEMLQAYLTTYERGLITVDEVMNMLVHIEEHAAQAEREV